MDEPGAAAYTIFFLGGGGQHCTLPPSKKEISKNVILAAIIYDICTVT